MAVGLLFVAVGALTARHVSSFEQSLHDVAISLPSVLTTSLRWLNTTGAVAAIVLIGDAGLCRRYRLALDLYGLGPAVEAEGATEAGLWNLAQHAGLLA